MKEKIKNFLLKIKKSLCAEIKTPVYKIMLFGLIMIVLSCISFSCANFVTDTLNDIQTEQVEEISKIESIRIDRDIKGANDIEYIGTPVPNSGNVDKVYVNINLTYDNVVSLLNEITFNSTTNEGEYVYVVLQGAYQESATITAYVQIVIGKMGSDYLIIDNSLSNGILFSTNNTYGVYGWSSTFDGVLDYQSYNASYINQSPGDNMLVGNENDKLSSLFSITPFETSSTPTLENAPTELVNTIPTNAVTTLPSNLGTKVYDSGSAWVQDPSTFTEYDGFGYQIYYKADILTSEKDMLRFTIDGITYDVEPTIYRYYLREVYVVIYTLWNNTPIYYVSENLMDSPMPFTLNYETCFDFHDLKNWFYVYVDIVNTYSDYYHIRFDYNYFMLLTHVDETNWLIDHESESFEALIFSTAERESIIKNDGFQLSVIPELDPNFAKMGQTQTDNMYSTIVHGGTINDVWSNAYHKGIDVGTASGYTDGYSDGIETGKTLQNPLNPIMDFISDGASVISNVFSFEILPNISLGTMLLFPLAIALIWFVIKLFMGG